MSEKKKKKSVKKTTEETIPVLLKPETTPEQAHEEMTGTTFLQRRIWEQMKLDDNFYTGPVNIRKSEGKYTTVDMPHYKNVWQEEYIDGVPQKFEAIEINFTTIEGNQIYLDKGSKKGKPYTQLRWDIVPPCYKPDAKYKLPGSNGTRPFFPQYLKQFYETGMHYDDLVLTEGAFKADVATKHKLLSVGLTSITHSADAKETDFLHQDILKVIDQNGIMRIIILWDGDCREISRKHLEKNEDLNTRPYTFYNQARKIKERIRNAGYNTEVWFCCINTKAIEGNPKGIDDLLLNIPKPSQAVDDLLARTEGETEYFHKFNISVDISRMTKFFNQESVDTFYNYHRFLLKDAPFTFDGTRYQYDEADGRCKILFTKELKEYMRVHDKYYRIYTKPNVDGDMEQYVDQIEKGTLLDDFGKDAVRHITKYKSFITIPDHFNHKPVVDNCYNRYYPFAWTGKLEECDPKEFEQNSTTFKYIRHIFGANEDTDMKDHIAIFLDYFKLLYERPQEKLPALCLVSTEKNTGKSTMLRWMRKIFTNNMIVVGNSQLHDNFNGTWSAKLLVCIDEALIEKISTLEMIKSQMTERKIVVRRMQKEGVAEDFFAKFMLTSNNIHSFIFADKYEDRFWVRYVSEAIGGEDVHFEDKLAKEIPQFLWYIQNRQMTYKKCGRFWFPKADYRTSAFDKVVEASRSTTEKNLQESLEIEFQKYPEADHLYFTKKDLAQMILENVGEKEQLSRIRQALLRLGYPDMPNSIGYKKWKIEVYGNQMTTTTEDARGRCFKFLRDNLFGAAKEKDKKEPKQLELTPVKSVIQNQTDDWQNLKFEGKESKSIFKKKKED